MHQQVPVVPGPLTRVLSGAPPFNDDREVKNQPMDRDAPSTARVRHSIRRGRCRTSSALYHLAKEGCLTPFCGRVFVEKNGGSTARVDLGNAAGIVRRFPTSWAGENMQALIPLL